MKVGNLELPDGSVIADLHCDGCGVNVRQIFLPESTRAIEYSALLEQHPRAAIMALKKVWEDRGWKTAWGHDLCPDCIEEAKNL